jgi:hypothetical protein
MVMLQVPDGNPSTKKYPLGSTSHDVENPLSPLFCEMTASSRASEDSFPDLHATSDDSVIVGKDDAHAFQVFQHINRSIESSRQSCLCLIAVFVFEMLKALYGKISDLRKRAERDFPTARTQPFYRKASIAVDISFSPNNAVQRIGFFIVDRSVSRPPADCQR